MGVTILHDIRHGSIKVLQQSYGDDLPGVDNVDYMDFVTQNYHWQSLPTTNLQTL